MHIVLATARGGSEVKTSKFTENPTAGQKIQTVSKNKWHAVDFSAICTGKQFMKSQTLPADRIIVQKSNWAMPSNQTLWAKDLHGLRIDWSNLVKLFVWHHLNLWALSKSMYDSIEYEVIIFIHGKFIIDIWHDSTQKLKPSNWSNRYRKIAPISMRAAYQSWKWISHEKGANLKELESVWPFSICSTPDQMTNLFFFLHFSKFQSYWTCAIHSNSSNSFLGMVTVSICNISNCNESAGNI